MPTSAACRCGETSTQPSLAPRSRSLIVGDIGNLPVAPQSFHHIVCRGVVHRLADVGRGFEQLFAALKEGGDLVIAEPIKGARALTILRDAASAAGIHPFPGRRIDYLTTREWIEAAEAAGFRAVRWFPLGYLAFPLLGFPEAIALMRYIPCRMVLATFLLRVDRVLAGIPYVGRWSWQAIFHFHKPAALAPLPFTASAAINTSP